MTNQQLTVPSKCVVFRNGVEIWIPEGEKLDRFQNALDTLTAHMFVRWEGRNMNTADIVGIILPEDMADMKRRKNGDWVCRFGEWHGKHQECACRPPSAPESTNYEDMPPITEEERQRNLERLEEVRRKAFPGQPSK